MHFFAFKENGISFNSRISKKLIQFQLPLIPSDFIAYASRQVERFMVRFLISIQGVGVLEMAYKFPPLLNLLISFPFGLSWRTKSIEIADQENAPHIIGEMFTNYIFFMIFGALTMFVAIPYVIVILTPKEFWFAIRIAKIEIITTVLAGITTYMLFGLIYKKRTKEIALIRSICALVKIALSYSFIQFWGLRGAALSALLVEIIILLLIFCKSQNAYKIELEYRKILFLIIIAITINFTIAQIDFKTFSPALFFNDKFLHPLSLGISSSPVGVWKDGKIISLLIKNSTDITALIFSITFSSFYLLALPIIRYDLINKISFFSTKNIFCKG